MTYTATTLDGSEFTADDWDALVTKIGDWQGENVDDLNGAVEIVSAHDHTDWPVHFQTIAKLNKDLEVWFENERELSRNMDKNEHRTLWNNDGRA